MCQQHLALPLTEKSLARDDGGRRAGLVEQLVERAAAVLYELRGRGEDVSYDAVLDDIRRRDARDEGRAAAPLVSAADARLLDTTSLSIEAAFQAAVALVDAARQDRVKS
jgi:cytidylate kinase